MKRLILSIILLTLTISNAQALDLEVYGGKFLNSRNFGLNTSENPEYVAGVEVAQDFLWRKLKVYTALETLMDGNIPNGVGGGVNGYHPTSIKYTAGGELDLYAGFGLRAEHMCHHALGSGSWYGAQTAQYTNVQIFYRFTDILKK